MIVVDTSVWIEFLRGSDQPQALRLEQLIDASAPVALTDVVMTELLQGVPSDDEAELLEARLLAFPMLKLERVEDFALAASLYRQARGAGVTIRKTLDCLIAAPCVRARAPLLHADADFDRLAGCTALEVVP